MEFSFVSRALYDQNVSSLLRMPRFADITSSIGSKPSKLSVCLTEFSLVSRGLQDHESHNLQQKLEI